MVGGVVIGKSMCCVFLIRSSSGGGGGGGGQRRATSSLCVLSPFDEQEEWIKILEILSSCNSGLAGTGGDSTLVDEVQKEFQNRIG